MTNTLLERFEAKYTIEPGTDCWLWTATTNHAGYGMIKGNSRASMGAHRASWELYRGPIPEGLCVCHACDVPACVNPDHLWLGTRGDNNRDRDAKGRNAPMQNRPGSRHPNSKLTEWEVLEIVELSEYANTKELMAAYGVGQEAICSITSGRTWAWLTEIQCPSRTPLDPYEAPSA